ncbi:GEVED domain-containing protein [Chryseobacterium echinoideorum]|uniref:GEVED domain-containing protein n=1 Tax=Chryseobacterium echinoideorum TaxID=1549648 RepID=UPI0011864FB2|nr:GEVED domain-containing protein [Chryseobacterium echinoideorum]
MKKILLIWGLLIGLLVHAQVVQITTGTAGTPAYNAGPIYRSSASSSYDASRYSYLYTASELAAAGITSGTIINDLGWIKDNNATTNGGGIFRIYMKNSTTATYASATETWANLNTGTTLVYENLNQTIPATQSPNYIVFTLNTPFTYTGGSLEISVEWDINQVSGNPTTGTFSWLWSTVPNTIYGTGQTNLAGSGTLSSTTNSISTIDDRRPFLQIGYTPGTACSGSVTAGTASSTASAVCANIPFNLVLTGATSGGGITYQWQRSPAGAGTFTNIPGATTLSYSVTNHTAASDYRCVVTCTNGGSTQTSNIVTVGLNTGAQCLNYCTPIYVYNCGSGDDLNSFVITGVGGSTISDLNTGCNGAYYDRTTAFTPVDLLPAQSYPVQINTTYSSPATEKASIWIDFNDNGVFEASEKLLTDLPLQQSPAFATANIAIPSTAPVGVHRMRVRVIYNTLNVDACSSASYGETHDYNVNILPLAPCTTSAPTGVTVSNVTPTTAVVSWVPSIGATYVVRYRELPSGAWITANVTTPLASSYTIPGLVESTQYEVEVATICGGTQGAFSTAVPFTTPALSYCTSNPTSTTVYEYISNVTVNPTGGTPMVSNSATPPPFYSDYTTDPARLITLYRGTANNSISVTKTYPNSLWNASARAWIDFNRNGVFEDSERILDTPSNQTALVNGTFSVPGTAAQGAYMGNLPVRMRVILRESGLPDPCGTFSYGEVEDYNVKLVDLLPCTTAAPTPITVTTPSHNTAVVSWTPTLGANYVIRWRLSPNGPWLPSATGQALPTGTPTGQSSYTITGLTEQTAYQVQVQTICNGTTGAFSPSVNFTTTPISYCPMVGTGTNDYIANVTVTPVNFPVVSNTTLQTNYASYTTPVINLEIGSIGNQISVGKGWDGTTYSDAVTAWIDYNRDGVFANDERILISAASTTTPVTANFNVPNTAYTGPYTTTMRVALRRTSAPVMCTGPVNGEVEDYAVRLRPCSNATPGTPTFNTITHTSANIVWTPATNNLSYVIQYRPVTTPASAWTSVNVSSINGIPPYPLTGLTPATQYEVQIAAICNTSVGTFTPIRTFTTRCDPTPPNVVVSNVTANSAVVTWNPLVGSANYILRYREVGTGTWITVSAPTLPQPPLNSYTITGLSSFVTYEVQVANICVGETTPNNFSNPQVFTTVRLCEVPPPGLTITQLNPTSAVVVWDAFTGPGATNSYIFRYRKVGIPGWNTITVNTNTYTITGLLELTKYEMQVANVCSGTPGNFTPPYYFTTPTVTYCPMQSANSTTEYISQVTARPTGKPEMTKVSLASTYTNYTNDPDAFIEMVQGSVGNQIVINKTQASDSGVAVWIDFNRNGEFDLNERILADGPNSNPTASATFTVPADAFVSMTDYKYVVMRVAMSKGSIPVNCTSFADGEVEDYTVRISKLPVDNAVNQTDILIYPNPVSTVLNVKNISKKANYKIYSASGQLISSGIILNNKIDVSRLINGLYVIDIDDVKGTAQKKFIKE